ncbi:MAG: ATP-dependent 6-phosphofructokinase [Spartobacteria bacterium]|nr:ATP-dependent 6-phosphofructokinase [Spartobacteria bacterium]
MRTITNTDLKIETLGSRTIKSPLPLSNVFGDGVGNFTPDNALVLLKNHFTAPEQRQADVFLEKAGSREYIYFDPAKTRAAIVTCGGLCPGINNVIRSAVRQLQNYGVHQVLGIKYGFAGMNPASGYTPIELSDELIEDIHRDGGTMLGTSRGNQPDSTIVDFLVSHQINILICIGGDGTQRGAHAIAQEIKKRGEKISIIGVPKTIDNDIDFNQRTFGFSTAIEEAKKVLDCAHVEAHSAFNGIGLVKVMGRDAGFIAVDATLASQEVNFTLIPEIPFKLDGEFGLLNLLKQRLARKHHAVIVVAEGAGQHLFATQKELRDASGNKLHLDIGLFLKDKITEFFAREQTAISLKYIDPSYIIRSVPANTIDAELCDAFARKAVDAAMAGKTDVMINFWNGCLAHIPIGLAIAKKNSVDPEGEHWLSVFETTGQPIQFMQANP